MNQEDGEEKAAYSVFSNCVIITPFLGASAKLRKDTISFVMSVRPSAWNNWAPTERNFVKFDICGFLENLSKKFQVSLKSDKNDGYFT